MRLQFHRELRGAYALLAASSLSIYLASFVLHYFFDESVANSRVVTATFCALAVIALTEAASILRRRRNDFAGWIGVVWWGGGFLFAAAAALSM